MDMAYRPRDHSVRSQREAHAIGGMHPVEPDLQAVKVRPQPGSTSFFANVSDLESTIFEASTKHSASTQECIELLNLIPQLLQAR
jgi:hypothetical protein